MKIAKGIKGIKAFLTEDRSGWHVFVNGRLVTYFQMPVSEILREFPDNYTLTGWVGNNLEIQLASQFMVWDVESQTYLKQGDEILTEAGRFRFDSCYSDTRINVKDSEGNLKEMMIYKFPMLAIRKADVP